MARAKTDMTGLKQIGPKQWQCRITKVIDGKKKDLLYRIDERTGKPLSTQTEAAAYRRYILQKIEDEKDNDKPKNKDISFDELWIIYENDIAPKKAPNTVVKHTSVWENHIKPFCGDRKIKDVSVGEINSFLTNKYLKTELSFHYIEGFLKVFYMLYGIAYSYNYIDAETLNRYTMDKNNRITMPDMTDEDEAEEGKIEIYTASEIEGMYNIFHDTDLETAFLIAVHTGMRESEIFGLMWEDHEAENKILNINKQLICVKGVWQITGVKTLAGYRKIEISDTLNNYLINLRKAHIKAQHTDLKYKQTATEMVYDMRGKQPQEIVGGNFINRKLRDGLQGKLLTTNSLKFYSKKVNSELGFELRMHKIRKTHLSYLASHGYPVKALMSRAGHKRLSTSMRYYIDKDETAREQQERILNSITVDDPIIEFDFEYDAGKTIRVKKKKSEIDRMLSTFKK